MERETYIEMLNGSVYESCALELFDIFEGYVGNTLPIDEEEYRVARETIDYEALKSLFPKFFAHAEGAYKRSVNSLRTYVMRFFSQKVQETSFERFKKVLRAYLNVSRQVFIQNGQIGQNCLLAISLVDPGDTLVNVNEEITSIVSYARNKNISVFPVFGCTTNLYKEITNDINPSILHFAGHCDASKECKLQFLDGGMKYQTLIKYMGGEKELLVLNCCSTMEYVERKACASAKKTIVHKGDVGDEIAKNFATQFYFQLFDSGNIDNSFRLASQQEDPCLYYLL